ncbi:hypothetical protein DID73_00505 [Candidatus Marinamargulisbacteria bacterium SCGC AG-343-K17]|nr:hypothetical protein DID73_00505 [Candidatus Marinamargulisbacteria bacterium SCGC AG-343-K17]
MGREIAIIGGGLAGLSCAIGLQELGIPFKLFEASNELGGRVGSYKRKQLIVDKGFQVFLPHYKTSQQLLDISKLDLCYYPSGATIITNDGPKWFGYNYPEKLKTGKKVDARWTDYIQLGIDVLRGISRPRKPGSQCIDHFKKNYSESFSSEFLEPFFRGVFLDPSCEKSVRQFQYYLHCFFRKGAAIPKLGINEIPKQLVRKIQPSAIEMDSPISKIESNKLWINNKEHKFQHIVIATDFSTCYKLLKIPEPTNPWSHVTNYILAKRADTQLSPLILNTTTSPISHINIPTLISKHLAPDNTHYMNVSTFNEDDPKAIEQEVHKLTGETDWNFVWHNTIHKALPKYHHLVPNILNDQISICGDWTNFPSIEGAIESGYRFKSKAKTLIK